MSADTLAMIQAINDLQNCVGGLLVALILAVSWKG